MKKTVFISVLVIVVVLFFAGCLIDSKNDDDDRKTPSANDVALVLTADKNPDYLGTAQVTCRYIINYPRDHSGTETFIANGYFADFHPVFSIVSGDSSWVDTVQSYTEMEHTIVIRAHKPGEYLIDAYVGVPVDSTWSMGDNATLALRVR